MSPPSAHKIYELSVIGEPAAQAGYRCHGCQEQCGQEGFFMAGGYNFEGTSKTIRSIICTSTTGYHLPTDRSWPAASKSTG